MKTLNPMHDKVKARYREGERDDTCDHGISRRLLMINLLRVKLEECKSDDLNIINTFFGTKLFDMV